MADTGTRVPKMAKRCVRVTTSTGSASLLQSRHASEGNAGYMAKLAYRRMVS